VVVDPELSITKDAGLVATADEGPVLVICGPEAASKRRAEVEAWGVQTAAASRVGAKEGAGDGAAGLEPEAVARLLAARGVQTILLEGGPRLAGSWWSAGLVDKVAAFVCPQVFSGMENRAPLVGGGSQTVTDSAELKEIEVERIGSDVLVTAYSREPF
jgi:diaminohydroxyphosphoribosylaminopyrimidine deaminase/5-amino-6-(5-phosphoribosylamino)uracil reductase